MFGHPCSRVLSVTSHVGTGSAPSGSTGVVEVRVVDQCGGIRRIVGSTGTDAGRHSLLQRLDSSLHLFYGGIQVVVDSSGSSHVNTCSLGRLNLLLQFLRLVKHVLLLEVGCPLGNGVEHPVNEALLQEGRQRIGILQVRAAIVRVILIHVGVTAYEARVVRRVEVGVGGRGLQTVHVVALGHHLPEIVGLGSAVHKHLVCGIKERNLPCIVLDVIVVQQQGIVLERLSLGQGEPDEDRQVAHRGTCAPVVSLAEILLGACVVKHIGVAHYERCCHLVDGFQRVSVNHSRCRLLGSVALHQVSSPCTAGGEPECRQNE